ncbi:cell surface glycoprotein CD200 receptor 1 isoform X2 [Fundulus heteroclitus]|uniref:cell surface glycoprotein CD200 receptor 1 isoform X2 n=1 Tax=Fundulus heteroclitus TaxID=8078 RepID=UPI00165A8B19|nr:cell surface glycoprotein CD200 receptor 1 isoform X2 [Fundulus heteroclitus]
MIWIYISIFIFFFTESWSSAQGNTNSNTSVISNSTASPPKVYVNRKAVYNLGSTVELQCSNRTWIKTMFVIWDIELNHKKCKISFSNEGESFDSCNDGKSIRNNSIGQSFLHIPNFSASDVGAYKCELVYTGGNDNFITEVDVTAPPELSAWLERRNNKMVAVCRAERGKPAANISWSLAGNESVTQQQDPDGSVTVESQLENPELMDPENLTCIVRHKFWDQEKTLVPKLREAPPMLWILIPVIGIIFLLLTGFAVIALKKVIIHRQCEEADTPSKSPPTEDVEEVEPYASYVQRVNSIYN